MEPWQWGLGAACAVLVGFSKTGVPGSGILAVPMMAAIFGGRLSVGATLPILIFADCFAVAFYRAHAQWSHLWRLFPGVGIGLIAGSVALWQLGTHPPPRDIMTPTIGWIVLGMLAVSLLRSRFGPRWHPTSPLGVVVTGFLAGFTTLVSNAAGPVMQIYLVSADLPKRELMGTTAWYFFIVNLVKVPLLVLVAYLAPAQPLFNAQSLIFNLYTLPLVVIGALAGRWLLPFIPQRTFNMLILALTFAAAVRLVLT